MPRQPPRLAGHLRPGEYGSCPFRPPNPGEMEAGMRHGWWMAACVPLAIAACGDSQQNKSGSESTADGGTTVVADSAMTPGRQEQLPAPVQQNQAMAAQRQFQLQPVGGSGVSGTVTVVPVDLKGDSVSVSVLVSGGQGGGALPAHVHTGACDNIGPVVAPLSSVRVNQNGGGQSSTGIAVPIAALEDGRHLVSVHDAGGKPVACGVIPPGVTS
jgi:hypothetical protein